eukprot:XP_001709218.1 Hypothetical protein GL50803_38868 [Giardia lamblia ATCC 50803]
MNTVCQIYLLVVLEANHINLRSNSSSHAPNIEYSICTFVFHAYVV